MYTNEDYERLLVKYTSQGIPAGESIQHFCDRHKVPYNLFDKWYPDTRHKVVRVRVKVDGMPATDQEDVSPIMGSIMEEIKPQATPSRRGQEWTGDNPKPGSVACLDQHPEEPQKEANVRIMVDIRLSNGMQIRHRNLSYGRLMSRVEKDESE